MRYSRVGGLLVLGSFIAVLLAVSLGDPHIQTPDREFGVLIGNPLAGPTVRVEAFYDFLCPDSARSWLCLRDAVYDLRRSNGADLVSVRVYRFPLPYHPNSFRLAEASVPLGLNNTVDFETFMTFIFRHVDHYSRVFKDAPDSSALRLAASAAHADLTDESNKFARLEFKFGCSRGVTATPYYFINGVQVTEVEKFTTKDEWITYLKPFLKSLNRSIVTSSVY